MNNVQTIVKRTFLWEEDRVDGEESWETPDLFNSTLILPDNFTDKRWQSGPDPAESEGGGGGGAGRDRGHGGEAAGRAGESLRVPEEEPGGVQGSRQPHTGNTHGVGEENQKLSDEVCPGESWHCLCLYCLFQHNVNSKTIQFEDKISQDHNSIMNLSTSRFYAMLQFYLKA